MTTTTEPLAVLSVDGLTIPDAPKHVQRPRSIHVPAIERPAAVEQAASAHGDVLIKFADADERKRKAAKALVDARALDILTDADLVAAGDDPLPPAKRAEPKAQQALAEAERARLVATGAAARTYAKLEDAIRAELHGLELPVADPLAHGPLRHAQRGRDFANAQEVAHGFSVAGVQENRTGRSRPLRYSERASISDVCLWRSSRVGRRRRSE